MPDAGQTPEQILGLAPGLTPERQFARLLAESGCELVIPTLIRRELIQTADAQLRQSQQTWREWIYRQAFHMGRHPIGFEVQKVLAAVDRFRARRGGTAKIGVVGYAEGGLIAFYAAAIDTRIDGALVSGYFDRRGRVWEEPIDRNIWSLLERFSDAEIAALVLPRHLVIEHADVPSFTSSKGAWQTPSGTSVRAEFDRIPAVAGVPQALSRHRRRRSAGRRDIHEGARRFCQTPGLHAHDAYGRHAHRPPAGIRSGRAPRPDGARNGAVRPGIGARRPSMFAIKRFSSPSCPN